MAVTVTDVCPPQSVGQYKEKIVDITFDASYPTGGEAIAATRFGFNEILTVQIENATGDAVRTTRYSRATGKLLAYAPGDAEVADTTDLSAVTVRAVVRGR